MVDNLIGNLMERAKELECMYAVDGVLQNRRLALPDIMRELVENIPIGFSSPEVCRARIFLQGEIYAKPDFQRTELLHAVPIMVEDEVVGEVAVGFTRKPDEDPVTLLDYEIKLLDAISTRIALVVLNSRRELSLLLNMLHCADPAMLLQVGENMQKHLRKIMGSKAESVLKSMDACRTVDMGEVNTLLPVQEAADGTAQCRHVIQLAAELLPVDSVFQLIAEWMREQRINALVKTVDSKDASIGGILDAVSNYSDAMNNVDAQNGQIERWLLAELANRFLTSDERLVNFMLENFRIDDFKPLLQQIIGSATSSGNIGGKGAGLFIASQILKHAGRDDPLLADIKTPRAWFLATDQIVDFLHYNNLEELNAYKYGSPLELRVTYGGVAAKIKKAKLPPQTVQMLRVVLEELSDSPIIVRSSSLLEDRQSGAFSGKYKSLFLANRGTRQKRLGELINAILEIYASMYNPDALQYRRERGMLSISEQMGVLIQEVVGRPMGKYYLPVFAGVAFSHNLLRWSSRVTREGGLARIVPGLGTRAVDRVNDDYPALFSPGQPELRVNQTPASMFHYSPKFIDLINMESGSFETLELRAFLREAGKDVPDLNRYVSVYHDGFIQEKSAFSLDPEKDEMVATFHGLIADTPFPKKLKRVLDVLSKQFGGPVDIEFAHDGDSLYLLQCRPHNTGLRDSPAPIPKDLNPSDIVFTANRFVSDGLLEGITHVVYVDADAYGELSSLDELLAVGRAVGLLNTQLPRRKFILIGPGRWGSRGDVKLGVRVTYSDISGTAALIEVAKEQRSYLPELSFGTHFFQDLVESGIFYLPLYPDQPGIMFKESFFNSTRNLLPELLPEYAHISDALRVFDIPDNYNGRTLSLHMNSELEQAVAFLSGRQPVSGEGSEPKRISWATHAEREEYWQWRHYMAEQISLKMDRQAFGVKGVYLFGSTNTGTAGMGSDIDLLIHMEDDAALRRGLENWLDGWSRALARINYLRTGYEQETLLDIHVVTDDDIARGDSYAIKIHSPLDPASPLAAGEQKEKE